MAFDGKTSVTLAPGEARWSDPVELEVAPLEELALSLHFEVQVEGSTSHGSDQPAFLCRGDRLASESCDDVPMLPTWLFFTSAQVESGAPQAVALAAFGDSITDGFGPELRWTDWLARDFAGERRPVGLVNAGIAGNRLLRDTGGDQPYNEGASALSRFERDVLSQPGVAGVVVLLGVNDIGQPGATTVASEAVHAEDLIAGYRRLIATAHARGLRIWGGTLLPFQGAYLGSYWSLEKESVRVAVNRWTRESGEWDGVIDFDRLLRDPRHPARLRAEFDGGDHLHPGLAGFRAMAEAVRSGVGREWPAR